LNRAEWSTYTPATFGEEPEAFEQGVESHEATRIRHRRKATTVTAGGLTVAGTFASLPLTRIQLLEEI
jgi:hypothetical protein